MEGQEYLNQISKSTKSTKQSKKGGIFRSKFFIFGAVGASLLILIIVIGLIIGAGKGDEKTLSCKLKLHVGNTAEIIQEYQPNVRNSDLRSSSASLYGVLSNTDKELGDYLLEKYNIKPKEIDKKLTEKATQEKDALSNDLFEAKINGILDRIFAHKMSYEISLITTEEAKILNSTNNETLKEILQRSYDSLTNLYDKFNDFSETK